jgi:hypothetical protein
MRYRILGPLEGHDDQFTGTLGGPHSPETVDVSPLRQELELGV